MKEKHGGNYSFKLIDFIEQGMEGTRVEIIIPEEQENDRASKLKLF